MAEFEVLREDQENINKYGNLSSIMTAIDIDLERLKKEKDDCILAKIGLRVIDDDTEDEVFSDDDDEYDLPENVAYKLGGVFVELPIEECKKEVTEDTIEINKKIDELTAQKKKIQEELDSLYKVLKAKFGDSIGLGH